MKIKPRHIAGLFLVLGVFFLFGSATVESTWAHRQIESGISHGLIGLNVVLNALIWMILPPRKGLGAKIYIGRCSLVVALCAATVLLVYLLYICLANIHTSPALSFFRGDSGFAVFEVVGGSLFCSTPSAVLYLFLQTIYQFAELRADR